MGKIEFGLAEWALVAGGGMLGSLLWRFCVLHICLLCCVSYLAQLDTSCELCSVALLKLVETLIHPGLLCSKRMVGIYTYHHVHCPLRD